MMPDWRCWCRIRTVDRDGTFRDAGTFGGRASPDLEAVDRLARRLVTLRHHDQRPFLVAVDARLAELLELVGLADLVVEVQGEAEGGEEALRVDEVEEPAHGTDGPA
jgi:hypothetical protein